MKHHQFLLLKMIILQHMDQLGFQLFLKKFYFSSINKILSGFKKIVSWNVNSINAALKKGAKDYVDKESIDILCLQVIEREFQKKKIDEKKTP